jgi:hypothetical protein
MKGTNSMKELKLTRKISSVLFAIVFCLFITQTAFCQTEKLDIVEYTPPKGWTKTPKEGAVTYSYVNQSRTGLCVITVYASTASAGSPSKDFSKAWNELVVKPFKAEANPKTEMQSSDGWQAIVGGAAIEEQGTKAYAILTVFIGFGRTAHVLGVFTDESFVAQLDAFTQSIKLDKTAVAANPAPRAEVNSDRQVVSADKLAGSWATSSSGTRGRDPSGNVLNSGYYKRQYTFNRDGSYSFKAERWLGYLKANEYWMTEEQGSYTVAGDLLTVIPKRSITAVKNREGAVVRTQKNELETTAYRWSFHYFAGLQETQLILQTRAETNRDGAFASSDIFPNSYLLSQKYNPEWKFD